MEEASEIKLYKHMMYWVDCLSRWSTTTVMAWMDQEIYQGETSGYLKEKATRFKESGFFSWADRLDLRNQQRLMTSLLAKKPDEWIQSHYDNKEK